MKFRFGFGITFAFGKYEPAPKLRVAGMPQSTFRFLL
jgi:hypothetical protein